MNEFKTNENDNKSFKNKNEGNAAVVPARLT